MTNKIYESSTGILQSFVDYINSRYHITNLDFIEQRKNILLGNSQFPSYIYRGPFFESTTRYQSYEKGFSGINGLSDELKGLFQSLTLDDVEEKAKLFQPYIHQADAINFFCNQKSNLVVTTGTGSGKTESFLLPLLINLFNGIKVNPNGANEDSVRCLLLYPMNALVNDQLGRLRTLLSDKRIVDFSMSKMKRPLRFAKYTSRTPYPGFPTSTKHSQNLDQFAFFANIERKINDESSNEQERKKFKTYLEDLKNLGKWPAKNSLSKWFGKKGERWTDKEGNFIRGNTQQNDVELLSRYEIIQNPPDLLITNYSMLNYMLIRPLEQPIFDKTQRWLSENDNNQLVIIIDEAHLYSGSQGTEVAMLLERLYARLNLNKNKQLRVIGTTASMEDEDFAMDFMSRLSGASKDSFKVLSSEKYKIKIQTTNSEIPSNEIKLLENLDQNNIKESFIKDKKIENLNEQELYDYLINEYEPIKRVLECSMGVAKDLEELIWFVFKNKEDGIDYERVLSNLFLLGTTVKNPKNNLNLIPLRIHNFFSGLPGLWVCINPLCHNKDNENGGKLYANKKEFCEECNSKVYEYFTCNNCGSDYIRGYVDEDALDGDDNFIDGSFLFTEGTYLNDRNDEIIREPIDIYIDKEEKIDDQTKEKSDFVTFELDKFSGELNKSSKHSRIFFAKKFLQSEDKGVHKYVLDECLICNKKSKHERANKSWGQPAVQNHETKGSQPFHTLVLHQLNNQATTSSNEVSEFNPLQGRKVLMFSDSRRVAAELVTQLKTYSLNDLLRGLFAWGYKFLLEESKKKPFLKTNITLKNAFLFTLFGAKKAKIILRVKGISKENRKSLVKLEKKIEKYLNGNTDEIEFIQEGFNNPSKQIYKSLIFSLTGSMLYGLENLCFGTFREIEKYSDLIGNLPNIGELITSKDDKIKFFRIFLRHRIKSAYSFKFSTGFPFYDKNITDVSVGFHGYKNQIFYSQYVKDVIEKIFKVKVKGQTILKPWNDYFKELDDDGEESIFEFIDNNSYLNAKAICLDINHVKWQRCENCSSVHQLFELKDSNWCPDCFSNKVSIFEINDNSETYKKYISKFGGAKNKFDRMLVNNISDSVMEIGEHTANVSSAETSELFSQAEINELLFRDINLKEMMDEYHQDDFKKFERAVDILSCTTTMEVGIDIGQLSAVALRNLPPARANYQQRAGRAGRRGDNIATVLSFSNQNSHDQNYFTKPKEMVSASPVPPRLSKRTNEILNRNILALMFQKYTHHKLKLSELIDSKSETNKSNLFEAYGTLMDFNKKESVLNIFDFEKFIDVNQTSFISIFHEWKGKYADNEQLKKIFQNFKYKFEIKIKSIEHTKDEQKAQKNITDKDTDEKKIDINEQNRHEERDSLATSNLLLNFLIYEGLFPQYGFPTDVISFYVFKKQSFGKESNFRPEMEHSPSRSLKLALSEYAPGNQIKISGEIFTSKALYSRDNEDLKTLKYKLDRFYQCSECNAVEIIDNKELKNESISEKKTSISCKGCGNTVNEYSSWFTPFGFAHKYNENPLDEDDTDFAEPVFVSKPQLMIDSPEDMESISDKFFFKSIDDSEKIIMTNNGPGNEGYSLCFTCGLIEPSNNKTELNQASHDKPYPAKYDRKLCTNPDVRDNLRIGTTFQTNVLIISFRNLISAEQEHFIDSRIGKSVLTTLSYAFSLTITKTLLEINYSEVDAYFRRAFNKNGRGGKEVEIYIFDTLSGGAGYVSKFDKKREFQNLLDKTLELLNNCSCESSCYKCLNNFTNKHEHNLLDRIYAKSFLESVSQSNINFCHLDESRLKKSSESLAKILNNYFGDKFEFFSNFSIDNETYNSIKFINKNNNQENYLIICHPLSIQGPNVIPGDSRIINLINDEIIKNVEYVDDYKIQNNIPSLIKEFKEKFDNA